MFPAKKHAIVDMKADWEGPGIGGGHVKRDRAVTDLVVSLIPPYVYWAIAYLSSNCIRERAKRKAVIGPQKSGTTYHCVRVKD